MLTINKMTSIVSSDQIQSNILNPVMPPNYTTLSHQPQNEQINSITQLRQNSEDNIQDQGLNMEVDIETQQSTELLVSIEDHLSSHSNSKKPQDNSVQRQINS
jgi:hypothetical protein